MQDNIKVAIRVRPLLPNENKKSIRWECVDENTIKQLNAFGKNIYQFDNVFNERSNNASIFTSVVRPIVDSAVDGFNGTVFVYGQTSCGKTHTMMGNTHDIGVIPLCVNHIFDKIKEINRKFLIRVSYIEIYNEKVQDLLNPGLHNIKIYEDHAGTVYVKVKEEVANNPTQVIDIMKKGEKNRRIGSTNMNVRSSRSHTLFRIIIESRSDDETGTYKVAWLNLVDLAGSERLSASTSDAQMKEGTFINTSLSCLGLVIKQLSDGASFKNFRDSKLTRILQQSLGGDTKTLIIACITVVSEEETNSTLQFACRAKNVKNTPKVNETIDDKALMKRLEEKILSLQAENAQLQQKGNDISQFTEETRDKLVQKNRRLKERIYLLQKNLITGGSKKHKTKRRHTFAPTTLSPIKEFNDFSDSLYNDEIDLSRDDSILNIVDLNDDINQEMPQIEQFELDLIVNEKNNIVKLSEITTLECSDEEENQTPQKTNLFNTINEIETPVEVLRQRISEAQEEYTSLLEMTRLEKELSKYDSSEYLKQEAITYKTQYFEKCKEFEEQTEKIADLKIQNNVLEEQIISLHDEMSETVNFLISTFKEELEKLNAVLNKPDYTILSPIYVQKNIEREREIDSLKKLVEEKENCISSLNFKIEEFEKQFTDEKLIKHEDPQIFKIEMEEKLQFERNKNKSLMEQLETLHTENLDAEKNQLQQKRLACDHDSFINKINSQNESITVLNERNKELENSNQTLNNLIMTANEKLNLLLSQNKDLLQSKDEVVKELEARNHQLLNELKFKNEEIDQINKELKEIESQRILDKQLHKIIQDGQESAVETQKLCKKTLEELKEAKLENIESFNKIKLLQQTKSHLELKNAEAFLMIEKKTIIIESMYETLTIMQENHTKTTKTNDSLLELIKELKMEMATFENVGKNNVEAVRTLNENLRQSELLIKDLVASNKKHQEKAEELEVNLDELKKELQGKTLELQNIEKENDLLEQKLVQAESENVSFQNKLHKLKHINQESFSHLQIKNKRLVEKLEKKQEEDSHLKELLQEKELSLNQSKENVSMLVKQIEEMTLKLNYSENKIIEIEESHKAEANNQETLINNLKLDLKCKQSEINELTSSNKNYKIKLVDSDARFKTLTNELQTYKICYESGTLEKRKQEFKEKRRKALNTSRDLQIDENDENKSLMDQITTFKTEIIKKNRSIDELQKQIKSMNTQLCCKNAQLDALKRELKFKTDSKQRPILDSAESGVYYESLAKHLEKENADMEKKLKDNICLKCSSETADKQIQNNFNSLEGTCSGIDMKLELEMAQSKIKQLTEENEILEDKNIKLKRLCIYRKDKIDKLLSERND